MFKSFVAAAVLLCLTGAAMAVSAPIMQLTFDEGAGSTAADSSGYGHDGTLYNSPSWITGKFSNALQFNSTNSYVRVSDFSLTSEFSLSFWFKPAAGSLDANHHGYHYLFSWGMPFTDNSVNVWLTTASEPGWGVSIRTMVADSNDVNLADGYALTVRDALDYHFNDGNWHHYCLTVSKSGGRAVYLDGMEMLRDFACGGDAIDPNTNIYLGGRCDLQGGYDGRFYGGGIDDVQVFAVALTGDQVFQLYSPGAPSVSAGADQIVSISQNANLSGTVSDDGLPNPPGATTITWSQFSGPGGTSFADASSASTTATFSTTGVYVLRLTADDSAQSSWDDVTVTVVDFNPVVQLPFDDGAGTTSADSSGNGHNATLINATGWTAGKFGTALQFNGKKSYARIADLPLNSAFSVAFWFKPAPGSLDANKHDYHYLFSWGMPFTDNSVDVWLTTGSEPSYGTAIRTMVADTNDVDLDDGSAVTLPDSNYHFYDGNWHHYCLTVSRGGGRTVYLDGAAVFNDHISGGDTIDPNGNIFLGGRCDLDGARFYNGNIDDVRIYNAPLASSQVSDLYNTANPYANKPPVVTAQAGRDKTIPYINVTLSASVSDDGQPSALACHWSEANGLSGPVFADANALSTTVKFTTTGTYTLRLTATDGQFACTGDAVVTVIPVAAQTDVNLARTLAQDCVSQMNKSFPHVAWALEYSGDANAMVEEAVSIKNSYGIDTFDVWWTSALDILDDPNRAGYAGPERR